ncbi:hypothetical protein GCM10010345_47540 [Streptomyces canarius]|uniref:Peptide N-acetyl-beta-D-glucosaminyl asparaginase amidase A N-terminal domain-containing protein n=2 Tax=Streptomyces TaxID=1883 RepID=A0ABQ3CQ48_9ACTN|nr:hypothetical protein GCM10010345_47540 [Streptomyces canarius]
MSMLTGATLVVSALFGTGTQAAQAADVSAEFGTDWHDLVTAAPPVDRPHTKSCQVTLADARFRDFTPYRGAYTPPKPVADPAPYACKADRGPYREVRISVDGRLAGIAAPFPNVWTGGWSNPFLWYVVPAPRAFDVRPIEYDLTPFAGLLNDGRPHRVEVSVLGVPAGQSGWSAPVNVLVWQDAHRAHVPGALTEDRATGLADSSTFTPGAENRVHTEAGHRLAVSGHLDTSHGRVTTTVTRTLAHSSVHRWTDGEAVDGLDATWTDDEAVGVAGRGPARTTRTHRTYTMNGATTLGADDRLRTVLTLGDRASAVTREGGRRTAWSRLDDTYSGDATYTVDVPRDQRHAVGTSAERYRLLGSDGCYDRSLTTVQGVLTEDRSRC